MQSTVKTLLWCAAVLTLLLTGCDGSSHHSSSTDGTASDGDTSTGSSTVGVAVDPYIVGATFYEDKDNSGTQDLGEQESTPSDERGRFSFEQPLTPGSTLIMKTPGLHNGVAFTGTLRRLVRDGDGGELAATPMTTLLASGLNEEQVRDLLSDGGLPLSPEADLYADPMESLEGLNASAATKEGLILLKATMALNAYLSQVNAYDDQEDLVDRLDSAVLKDLAQAVSDTIDSSVAAATRLVPAEANLPQVPLQQALQTATAVVDHIAEGGASPTTATMEELVSLTYLAGLDDATLAVASDAGLETSDVEQGADYVIDDDGTVQTLQGLNEYLTEGLTNFSQLWSGYIDLELMELDTAKLLTAREAFKQAATLAINISPETATAHELQLADQARFFYALTRILTVLNMNMDDSSTEGFKDIGDIIETVSAILDSEDLPDLMSSRVFDFAYNIIGMELIGAMDELSLVSENFAYSFVPTGTEYAADKVELDYADALAIKGLASTVLALIDICDAYDLDFKTGKTYLGVFGGDFDLAMPCAENSWSIEKFLAENTSFGTLVRPQRLADAKVYLDRAHADLEQAFTALQAETDPQTDDFISFGELTQESAAEIDDILTMFKELLSGPATLSGGLITSNDVDLNLSKFFEGLNLRELLPTFNGNIPGLFPDATLGGILVNGDGNADIDADQIPDLLQDNEFFRLNEQRMAGKSISFYLEGAMEAVTILFNADLSCTVNRNSESVSATWSINKNWQLVVTWETTTVIVADTEGYDNYDGYIEFYDLRWIEQTGDVEAVSFNGYGYGSLTAN